MGVVRLTVHSCLLVREKVYAPGLHVAAAAAAVFVALADVHTPALLAVVFAALAVAQTAVAPPACFFETMLVPIVFVAVLFSCILSTFVSSCCFLSRSGCVHTFRE